MIDDWSEEAWDDLVKKSGMKTVPQIYVDGTLIGGFTQLAEVDAKDQLASLKG
jgi:glutaredoxin-related protein